MNSEPELSAEARRVIAAAKGYDDPTAEDRDRVKSRWLASVAAAASVSALGEAARAASTSSWGAKAVGWVLALAAGSAGTYALLNEPSPRDEGRTELAARSEGRGAPAPVAPEVAATPELTAPVIAAPEPAPAPAVPVPVVDVVERPAAAPSADHALKARPPAPVAKPAPARPSVPAASPPVVAAEPAVAPAPEAAALEVSPSPEAQPSPQAAVAQPEELAPEVVPAPETETSRQLGEETLLLSKARRSLREGAPARALSELAEHRQRFEKPLLGMEAAALRVDALCHSGNVAAARAEADLFQATWPSSPLLRRVRAACQ